MPKIKQAPAYSVSPADRTYFRSLCRDAMQKARQSGEGGIGTLGEKRLHAVIKRFICPNEDYHEVGILGTRYVADVCMGNDIYEVQTGSFYPMRKKIDHYLTSTEHTVTVVHPIAAEKWVTWLDPQTGETTPRKKSPKHERALDLFPELYSLLPHLGDPRLSFRLLFLEVEDFRLLDGWSRDRKKGSNRYERVPLELLGVMDIATPADFRALLPATLPSPFAVKDFSRVTGLRGRRAYSAVHSLEALGVITPTAPIARAMTFIW